MIYKITIEDEEGAVTWKRFKFTDDFFSKNTIDEMDMDIGEQIVEMIESISNKEVIF